VQRKPSFSETTLWGHDDEAGGHYAAMPSVDQYKNVRRAHVCSDVGIERFPYFVPEKSRQHRPNRTVRKQEINVSLGVSETEAHKPPAYVAESVLVNFQPRGDIEPARARCLLAEGIDEEQPVEHVFKTHSLIRTGPPTFPKSSPATPRVPR
jgi:hypothetical protein